MNFLKIEVAGYSWDQPCELIRKTFYVRDEEEFGRRVLEWERQYRVMEWHKTSRLAAGLCG